MVGRKISHYEILEQVGEGGMGVVYKARDTRLGRNVAIKIVNAEFTERFQREAKAIAALNHPHICTLYDVGEHEGAPYLVMEYVEGKPLKGPLSVHEALPFAIQVCEALAAAHKARIIHRDLKPDNILLTPQGGVKMLDFGLAKLQRRLEEDTLTATITVRGVITGTAPYMSPEQAQGEPVDERSDIFSFGAVLYELLSGRRAFRRETMAATLAAVIASEPSPLAEASPQLARIVDKMLAKKRESRYQSAEELLGDLTAAWGKGLTRRRLWPALAAAALIVIAAGGMFNVRGLRTDVMAWLRTPAPSVKLAVLPFLNADGNSDAEYLCQGISDNLITDLSRLPDVKVLSRDSVFRLASQTRESRQFRSRLGASVIVRGRLTKGRDSLSIRAELVSTSDDTLLWREEYKRSNSDARAIEQDIAHNVAGRLQVKPGGTKQSRLPAQNVNSESYLAYLQGRYYWNTRTEENLRKSKEAFQQAVDWDPGYALGWAGLADSFLMLGAWSLFGPQDSYPSAEYAAKRAIEIDEAQAEPHATLGYLKTLYERDWAGADREFRRAIQLKPDYATAHHWYAFYYQTIGKISRSLEEIETARELEPLSQVIISEVPVFYLYDKQYGRAEREARKVVDLNPSLSYARIGLAHIYAAEGKRQDALAELDRASASSRLGVTLLGKVAAIYAILGEQDRARAILKTLNEQERYVSPGGLAAAYANLGEKDRAIECLERSLEDKSLVASWLRAPEFDPLRSDPRFRALFTRLGLEP